jgi:hypothetical protein
MKSLTSPPIRMKMFTTNQTSIVVFSNVSHIERMIGVLIRNNSNVITIITSITKFIRI